MPVRVGDGFWGGEGLGGVHGPVLVGEKFLTVGLVCGVAVLKRCVCSYVCLGGPHISASTFHLFQCYGGSSLAVNSQSY